MTTDDHETEVLALVMRWSEIAEVLREQIRQDRFVDAEQGIVTMCLESALRRCITELREVMEAPELGTPPHTEGEES